MRNTKTPAASLRPVNIDGISRPLIRTSPSKRKSIIPKITIGMSVRNVVFVGVIILVIIAVGYAVRPKLNADKDNLNSVTTIQRLVRRHFVLPIDETPALATVTDKAKLTTKFLQKAENGDKILIYQKAGRVIIYRPSIDRIIDVGPVQIAPLSPSEQAK